MKLKHSNSTGFIKKKKINFKAIINNELLSNKGGKVQMALNHSPILSKNFFLQIAQKKIDNGKIRKIKIKQKNTELNTSSSNNENNKKLEEKDIPYELHSLLNEYEKKFVKENDKFLSAKEYNDAVLEFWRSMNKKNEKKKEREILLKKYFPENDGVIALNLHSDEIQNKTKNLFKSNPLLTYNKNSDIFFYFLSEFIQNSKNENKIMEIKQKMINFLNKIKNFKDYIAIERNDELDSIGKDIKLKNSKYVKEYSTRLKNEIIKFKEKNNQMNKKTIEESKKMIDETKNTLCALDTNKNFFEDPKNFDPYYSSYFTRAKSNYNTKIYYNNINNDMNISNIKKIRFITPVKTLGMSRTSSTGFNISYTKNNLNNKKKKPITINFNNSEENKFVSNKKGFKERHNIIKFNNFKKTNLKKVLRRCSSITSNIYNNNNYNYNYNHNHTKIITSFNNKSIPIIKKNKNKNIYYTGVEKINAINSLHSSYHNEEPKKRMKTGHSESKFLKIKKNNNRINLFTLGALGAKNLTNNNILSNRSNSEEKSEKNDKKGILNLKRSFNYNKGKDSLTLLYDDIQKKYQIKKEDVDNIKNYFTSKGKNFDLNFTPMHFIRKVKKISDNIDIEKRTKKVFHPYLSYKQVQKLDDVTKINNKVYKLDYNYLTHLFDFKSRNSESIQELI